VITGEVNADLEATIPMVVRGANGEEHHFRGNRDDGSVYSTNCSDAH
jgi:hypothetical protein